MAKKRRKLTRPKPYQREGIDLINGKFKGRALIADEMGLGKSFQALRSTLEADEGWPLIIVCDATLKFNWEQECKDHLRMRATILNGTRPPKNFDISEHRIIILNWEIVGSWIPVLLRMKAKTVIIDECQRICNRAAKRTKNVKRLCRRVPRVLALSGTPLTNRPAELFTVLNLLRPDKFPAFWSYAMKYCTPRMRPWGWEFKGAKNIPKLHKRLKKILMLRRLKEDVLKDLPTLTREVIPLPITNRAEYQEARKDFRRWANRNLGKGKARRAMKAEHLTKVGYMKRLAAKLKLANAIAWFDAFLEDTEGKIIAFGIHKSVVRALHEHYHKISGLLDGSVPPTKRKGVIKKWKANDRQRVLFCNNRVGGVGWNGTEAQYLVHFEIPWTPAELDQCDARAHRMGAKKDRPITSYILVARDTVEERHCEIIQDKQGIFKGVMDGEGSSNNLSIFDLLTKELLKS